MIQQLKAYFGEDIKINETVLSADYSWFLVEGNKVGIRKIRLHQKEHQLLSSILTPIHTDTFYKTELEKSWHEALYKNKNISILSVRFLHFFTTQSIAEREEFQDALQSMFSFTTTLIWETSQAGVLILEENITESVLQTALDTLETDFFISLSFFVGRRYTQTAGFTYLYQWERNLFSILSPYLSKKITYIEQLLPYQLVISLPIEERKKYTNQLLTHISNDKELINSVKVFFQCNLNVSLAAKQLYLHRNTLQYRIDKFIEKTGINIKTFEGAVAVYMAFLSLDIS
ncbi:TPA: helix-turn-helix domain-containing protein [Bacillus cereus]|uniref:PucR family transcriptional regulator n=1 Tax=Bacillus cereus group TaxID=86661 RepID=UPI0007F94B04|nr:MULTISPECIES: helix-turn-helix domain-containing protein [Bacillus cereus group]ARV92157.1 Fis family transcriptional regulator [Bacillus thuringiensis]MCB5901690.1 helix-turn-helix domain-containing protein [Bacillus cereus]MCC2456149.1 helix-turn-helix domain-containing protein [Bacillus cereus]MCU5079535.1 helix-turn-helix domain-containing protein [Bacillus cereus]MDZ4488148.1 helix-turn-helix domain-containing protein [Bacillus cereus]